MTSGATVCRAGELGEVAVACRMPRSDAAAAGACRGMAVKMGIPPAWAAGVGAGHREGRMADRARSSRAVGQQQEAGHRGDGQKEVLAGQSGGVRGGGAGAAAAGEQEAAAESRGQGIRDMFFQTLVTRAARPPGDLHGESRGNGGGGRGAAGYVGAGPRLSFCYAPLHF